jgi:hypothetical protein
MRAPRFLLKHCALVHVLATTSNPLKNGELSRAPSVGEFRPLFRGQLSRETLVQVISDGLHNLFLVPIILHLF